MQRYNKFIVALIGVIVIGLQQFFDITIPYTPEGITEVLIALAAAVGVERIANKE